MISVCLATYNGEKYLRDQIDSIISQLGDNDELVVSDDGSTDKTIEIVKSYKDQRIKIFYNFPPHGVNHNFENALEHAKGEYIFLSDQDDVWLPGKIEACIEALRDYDCVIHDAVIVNENLEVLGSSFFKERKSGSGFWKNLYKNSYLGCCMAFKKNILSLCLPIPYTNAYFHDNWIGGIADLKFSVIFIPFKGIYFRRHNSNTSSTAKKSRYSIFQRLFHRIIQLKDVTLRLLFNPVVEHS